MYLAFNALYINIIIVLLLAEILAYLPTHQGQEAVRRRENIHTSLPIVVYSILDKIFVVVQLVCTAD